VRRRSFLQAGAAVAALNTFPRAAFAQQLPFDPKPGSWRTFEITTRVEILKPQGASRAWVPLPSVESDYQKVIGSSWSGNASVRKATDPKYGAAMAVAEWSAGEKAPMLQVSSTFATRNRAVDFGKRNPSIKIDPATAKFRTAPTELIPTDGIVRKTAYEITRPEVWESPAAHTARKTAWTEKMRSLFQNTRRSMCRLILPSVRHGQSR